MKRSTLVALAAFTPVVAAGVGVAIARFANANASDASGYCAEPTVWVDMADGVSMATGGPDSIASCEGNTCRVEGAEQVEVQADGRVQCVNVNEGQALALTRRDGGVSLIVTEAGR